MRKEIILSEEIALQRSHTNNMPVMPVVVDAPTWSAQEYQALDVFHGEHYFCTNCSRLLVLGEVISLHISTGRPFCFSDDQHGCAVGYAKAQRTTIHTWPMRYRGRKMSLVHKTPNYPQTPVFRAHEKIDISSQQDGLISYASHLFSRFIRN